LTALHLAANCGCYELVALLLRAGAAVDCQDENCSTPAPLMFATMNRNPQTVLENHILATIGKYLQ